MHGQLCEWPTAIFSQACASQPAPINQGVMCFTGHETQEYPLRHELNPKESIN